MTRRRDDEGTILFLTIGMCVVLLLLVAVVVDVSAVVLDKRALSNAADGAAVAAAQQADREALNAQGLSERLPLDEVRVAQVVATYEADERSAQRGIDLQGRVQGGTEAVVDAYRTVRLPFSGWLRLTTVKLHAVGRARSPVVP